MLEINSISTLVKASSYHAPILPWRELSGGLENISNFTAGPVREISESRLHRAPLLPYRGWADVLGQNAIAISKSPDSRAAPRGIFHSNAGLPDSPEKVAAPVLDGPFHGPHVAADPSADDGYLTTRGDKSLDCSNIKVAKLLTDREYDIYDLHENIERHKLIGGAINFIQREEKAWELLSSCMTECRPPVSGDLSGPRNRNIVRKWIEHNLFDGGLENFVRKTSIDALLR